MRRPGELGVFRAVFRLTSEKPVVRTHLRPPEKTRSEHMLTLIRPVARFTAGTTGARCRVWERVPRAGAASSITRVRPVPTAGTTGTAAAAGAVFLARASARTSSTATRPHRRVLPAAGNCRAGIARGRRGVLRRQHDRSPGGIGQARVHGGRRKPGRPGRALDDNTFDIAVAVLTGSTLGNASLPRSPTPQFPYLPAASPASCLPSPTCSAACRPAGRAGICWFSGDV